MSTLNDARMPSLKDKILAQAEEDAKKVEEVAEEKEKEDEDEKKGKGRRIKSKTKK